MELLTSGMGFILICICAVIIFIFLWDFLNSIVGIQPQKERIAYRILYKDKKIDDGTIEKNQLPVQFGRTKGYNNDITVVPAGKKWDSVSTDVSRAWFFIQESADGRLMLYSADISADGKDKKLARENKLRLVRDGQEKRVNKASLTAEEKLTLKAGDFYLILGIEK